MTSGLLRLRPAPPVRQTLRSLSPASWALVCGLALAAIYLVWNPLAPDLAAQVARTNVVRNAGNLAWWTGWFGGLSMPSYSLLAPTSMAIFGVRVTGVVAAVAGAWLTAKLVDTARRPRAGAVAFAIAQMANLIDGRVTFAMGLTGGVAALLALKSRRPVLAGICAVATYCASPLAAFFLGVSLVAVVIVDTSRRRSALGVGAVLLLLGVGTTLLFPGSGTMPFHLSDVVPAGLCCLGVALFCPNRVVRVTVALIAGSLPIFLIIPGAVGDNVTRLAWVCAVPLVVAYAPLKRPALAVSLSLLALWPAVDLVTQLQSGHEPSSAQSFYQPLAAAIASEQATAGPAAIGQRVEVVDTKNHWASAYLESSVALARGWYRQADVAYNPIFYQDGALTAQSYRVWLDELAVGWVALPSETVRLDYSAVGEGKLVRAGLPYLTPVWSDVNWTLYRVKDATSLALGARVTGVDPGGVTFAAGQSGAVTLRMRWSPYLVVTDPSGLPVIGACTADNNGWLGLRVPAAGQYRVMSHFDPVKRVSSTQACGS
jgi:hypothetical protein